MHNGFWHDVLRRLVDDSQIGGNQGPDDLNLALQRRIGLSDVLATLRRRPARETENISTGRNLQSSRWNEEMDTSMSRDKPWFVVTII